MITTEKYRKAATVPVAETEAQVVQRATRLKAEGFETAALRMLNVIVEQNILAMYPAISDEDRQVWQEFLPWAYYPKGRQYSSKFIDHYWETHPEMVRHRYESTCYNSWADMAGEPPPDEVLEEIAFAKKHFPDMQLEIWSQVVPDGFVRESRDPLVVGFYGRHTLMIARWGEALQPFEKIKELVGLKQAEKAKAQEAAAVAAARWDKTGDPAGALESFLDTPTRPPTVTYARGFIPKEEAPTTVYSSLSAPTKPKSGWWKRFWGY